MRKSGHAELPCLLHLWKSAEEMFQLRNVVIFLAWLTSAIAVSEVKAAFLQQLTRAVWGYWYTKNAMNFNVWSYFLLQLVPLLQEIFPGKMQSRLQFQLSKGTTEIKNPLLWESLFISILVSLPRCSEMHSLVLIPNAAFLQGLLQG